KHRAAGAVARRVIEISAIPIKLRRAVKTIRRHAEFAEHQRLIYGRRSRHAIRDELTQSLRRVHQTVVIVARIVVPITVVDARHRWVLKPLTPFGRGAITPDSRRNHVIGIKRFEIAAHLRQPRAPLVPAASETLPLIYQLISEDRPVIAIED